MRGKRLGTFVLACVLILSVGCIPACAGAGVQRSQAQKVAIKLAKVQITKATARENGKVKLQWEAVANADAYEVYRAEKKNGSAYELLKTTKKTKYTDKTGKARKMYRYRVRAIAGLPETADSAAAESGQGNAAATQAQAPAATGAFSETETIMCRAKPRRTAFLGDSVMSGFKYYGYFHAHEKNFAEISRFIPTVLSKDIPRAIDYKPDRVYIMVGTNDCGGGTISKSRAAWLAKSYKALLTKLHKSNSKMEIVVMGIGPVRHVSELTNKSVRRYNSALKKMCKKLSYAHYFDPGETLRKGGILASGYDGGDGVHWAPKAYRDVRKKLDAFVKEW